MKQFESVEKNIQGTTFYIRPFGAFTAANLSGELGKILMPFLGAVAPAVLSTLSDGKGEVSDGKSLFDIDSEEIIPDVMNAFSNVSGDQLERLLKKLLATHKNISYLREDGKAIILNEDMANELFCGSTQGLFLLAFEVIRVNFNGFFGNLGNQSGAVSKLVKKVVPSMESMESSI